jgi:hypothetical protein
MQIRRTESVGWIILAIGIASLFFGLYWLGILATSVAFVPLSAVVRQRIKLRAPLSGKKLLILNMLGYGIIITIFVIGVYWMRNYGVYGIIVGLPLVGMAVCAGIGFAWGKRADWENRG